MIVGASSEISLGRSHSSGTLSVSAAVRASDLICDVKLRGHSTSVIHQDAIGQLSQVPNSGNLVADLSLCISLKTEFNYHASNLTLADAQVVLDAAKRLANEAIRLLDTNGAFPTSLNIGDYAF